MGMIAPLDSAFLIQEAREHPMHVAGLQLYRTPPGSTEEYVGDLYQELLTHTEVAPMFARRPRPPLGSVGNMWWINDNAIDIEYHVRRSALPRPGRVRELLELVSRLHGSLLDRHRPLWEYHLIEGLADGRFASYAKSHHALADGVTLTRKVMKALSVDPETRGLPPMWAPSEPRPRADTAGRSGNPLDAFRSAATMLSGLGGVVPMLAKYGAAAIVEQTAVLPYAAPRTMLNQPISGSRRVAAQSWDIARVLKVAKTRGVTLNDMVLAMSAGALRRYLMANDALPDDPLIASVPVSMRTKEGGGEGNAITFVLCNLATNLADPEARLDAITASMRATKEVMAGRPGIQLTALGILTAIGPSALTRIPGSSAAPPPYNVLISNVPGPRERLYWNGAELEAVYPLSIPTENQALNITCLSYADHLEFGLVGCRRTVPKLQRLLDYLEESLQELE
ncbi:wax ester/triacylglycerol synthase family O-acyltransferase [Mycolicibacterium sp.]|uniref:WS/DGAT/MGAT family O-acyltransferase n=1 Tax=Mycolicibacterium sp. TaxID=2320850 RepID=UPI002600A8B7|nr:wax ester/triacylglycerol synthase family O-acyltransferase [Mycolicibacterium sp.]